MKLHLKMATSCSKSDTESEYSWENSKPRILFVVIQFVTPKFEYGNSIKKSPEKHYFLASNHAEVLGDSDKFGSFVKNDRKLPSSQKNIQTLENVSCKIVV